MSELIIVEFIDQIVEYIQQNPVADEVVDRTEKYLH
ncbi:MAG: hypothetical protein ACJAZM_001464 [Cyclobacteriaceae bacterium]|jgi:hypothetical protein